MRYSTYWKLDPKVRIFLENPKFKISFGMIFSLFFTLLSFFGMIIGETGLILGVILGLIGFISEIYEAL
jgi:hypothetical protein